MTESIFQKSHLTDSIVAARKSQQFVGFMLSGQEYAFSIEKIREIVIPLQITSLPQVPEYVQGITNLRGTIIPIINMRQLFALDPIANDAETRVIVVNVGTRTMGCLVDAVTQVHRITQDAIQPAPEIVQNNRNAYISGFAKLNEKPMVLLNVEKLLDPAKLDQVHADALRQIATRL